ncbi:glycosyltransferase family 2 protein [Sphingomonas aerophila]|uniref:Glycosyltransferase n=1 Tax=Sphingomonas aerophila TaxID=1344948 RepID=A0A7W9BGS8_9SPHN|nr:dolichol-phosphate mannosyltransferase [Sphingomonas aerophila]MBB5716868.1 hypothetical protein [Sphingomonas aerophila]
MNSQQEQVVGAAPIGPDLSVVICIEQRVGNLQSLLDIYRRGLAPLRREIEFIFVVAQGSHAAALGALAARGEIKIVQLPRQFGNAACLREGVRLAAAEDILLLPPYLQVVPSALPGLVEKLADADLVVASRERRRDALGNRARGAAFRNVARITGSRFDDLGCQVRVMKRGVLDRIVLQEQIGFLPVLAEHAGFKVEQVRVPQAADDQGYRSHDLRSYARNTLDILSVGFLMRFLQKPFRLFGAIGIFLTLIGVLQGIVLLLQRANGVALSDRPALLLAVLLIVLGLQVAAVGLIAEVVLFTRLPATSTYRIRRIVGRAEHDV